MAVSNTVKYHLIIIWHIFSYVLNLDTQKPPVKGIYNGIFLLIQSLISTALYKTVVNFFLLRPWSYHSFALSHGCMLSTCHCPNACSTMPHLAVLWWGPFLLCALACCKIIWSRYILCDPILALPYHDTKKPTHWLACEGEIRRCLIWV